MGANKTAMSVPLNVLIVEDVAVDAELLIAALESAGYKVTWKRVDEESPYRAKLNSNLDLIFSDFKMPRFSVYEALEILHENQLEIPFIVISGTIGEEQAVECLKAGATDYVLKGRLHRLGPAVERALRETKHQQERKRAEQQLRQSREQLRALTARLQDIREEEQKRIAREIHDELGQMLTGLKLDLRWIERELDTATPGAQTNKMLEKAVAASEVVDTIVKAVQRIAAQLRPGVLDRLGLCMALRHEGKQFEERAGIPCRLDLPEPEPSVPMDVATACYRIGQEALTNVARHARAKAVELIFRAEPTTWVLEVRDNGTGISADCLTSPHSLGLVGMQERAHQLGGQVSIEATSEGQGTLVRMQIPRKEQEKGTQ